MDTESMGLHAWYPDKHIVSIGFTCEAGKADCLYLGPYDDPVLPLDPDLFEQIEWLLTSPKVKLRGSNLKHDLIWLATKWGIECTNFKFDTCLVGSILDVVGQGSGGLHDNYGSALAAQPGGSQGAGSYQRELAAHRTHRPAHTSCSQRPAARMVAPYAKITRSRRARQRREHHAGYQPARAPERGDPPPHPGRAHLSQPGKLPAPGPGARGRNPRGLAGASRYLNMDLVREHKKEQLRQLVSRMNHATITKSSFQNLRDRTGSAQGSAIPANVDGISLRGYRAI
jgi:hypothetical protein